MLLPRCLLRCGRPAEERVKEPYTGVTTNYFLFRSTRALAQVGAGLHKLSGVFGWGRAAAVEVRTSLFGVRRLSAVCTPGASPHATRPRNPGQLLMLGVRLSNQIPGLLFMSGISELGPLALHAIHTSPGRLDRTAAGEDTLNLCGCPSPFFRCICFSPG